MDSGIGTSTGTGSGTGALLFAGITACSLCVYRYYNYFCGHKYRSTSKLPAASSRDCDDTTSDSATAAGTGSVESPLAACRSYHNHHNYSNNSNNSNSSVGGYAQLIGNTPMVKLEKLSALTGCTILVKMESLNPGGTGKDRAAKWMLQAAAKTHPNYRPGCSIVEGTSGSTGIALAALCRALDLQLHVVMPDDQSMEKRRLLETFGAIVTVVPNCAISNKNHYVNRAKTLADSIGGVFIHQFENLANFQAHFDETGPEIWQQTNGDIDAFVMSAGTGGTIAGCSRYLKSRNPSVRVVLADPNGSSLHMKVKYNVCYAPQQSERTLRKHRYDTIAEGVGIDRLTANFNMALIDDSEQVMDQEIVDMAHWLLRSEGLFVGSSSAMNVVAACRTARLMGPGRTIVTIICDNGQRYLSRFWNPKYLQTYNLTWPDNGTVPECLAHFVSTSSAPC